MPDDALRLLDYLVLVERGGQTLTIQQLDRFAAITPPRWVPPDYGYGTDDEEGLTLSLDWSRYLQLLGWIDVDAELWPPMGLAAKDRRKWDRDRNDARVRLTELGRGLRQALSSDAANEATSVLLGEAEPLAYGLLLARLAARGLCLLVDPYLTDAVLLDLLKYTNVNRVLTSDKGGKRGKDRALAVAALAAQNASRRVQVRLSDALHDRYVLTDDGAVEAIGTSLNSVSKNATTVVPIAGQPAMLLRGHYEALWKDATVLVDAHPEPTDRATDTPSAPAAPTTA